MNAKKLALLGLVSVLSAGFLVAVQPITANAATSTITVDASTNLGTVTHNVAGILHGITLSDPAAAVIDPLHIPFWRSNTDFGEFPASLPRAATIGAQPQWILGDHEFGGTWPGDGGDYTAWLSEITNIYNDAQTAGVEPQWDIWNEPNTSTFWGRSQAQFFETWRQGVLKIRALDPNAVVVGPSINHYDLTWLQSFFTYAKANGVLPDILSWHFTDSLTGGDPVGAHLGAEVTEISSWMAANSITVSGIQNNESGLQANEYKPAYQVQLLANLQRSGVTYAAKACWGDTECFGSNLNGLLTTSTLTPRSAWWARKAYGDLSGHLVGLTPSSGSGVDGLASDDGSTIHVMASQIGSGPDTAETLQLNGLGSTSFVHVVANSIPDSETNALASPNVVLDAAYPVTGGSATIVLPAFPVNGAYELVVQRAGARASVGFSPNQGGNSWGYAYSTDGEASMPAMTYDSSQRAWTSGSTSDPNCKIGGGSEQPGNACDAILTWTAQDTGLATISTAASISVAAACGGSGVDLMVMKNGGYLWPTFGVQHVNNGSSFTFPSVSTRVTKGDKIQFVVIHHGSNNLCDVTTWDPIVSVSIDTDDSSYAYSTSESTNNWTYQYSTNGDATFSDMTYSAANNWWTSSSLTDPYCLILQDSQHPGTGCDSARTWVAPSSGTAIIRTNGAVTVQAACGGSGSNVKIMLNSTQIWPSSGWQSIANSSSAVLPTLAIKVATGNKIRLVVSKLGTNNNCARTYWDDAISLSSVDDSLTQYTGTQDGTYWSYEYSTDSESTFHPMSYSATVLGGEWTAGLTGANQYCVFVESGQHPGSTCDSVRSYTAAIAGNITIQPASIQVQPSCSSSGVKLRVLKNTTQIWPASGWQTAANGTTLSFPSTAVTVAAGDKIRFVLAHDGSNNNCDRTAWLPQVSY